MVLSDEDRLCVVFHQGRASSRKDQSLAYQVWDAFLPSDSPR